MYFIKIVIVFIAVILIIEDVDPNGTVQYSTNKTNSSLEEVKRPKRDFWKSIASYDLKKGGRGGGSRGGGRGKRRGKGGGGGGGRRSTGCRKQNNAALILIPSMSLNMWIRIELISIPIT
ncbi:uncharacterized protein [Drosophila takahashii]|uniref:uncharacterized protein isoform X1 n=1 Tax=Drosophila takahashii TaxID=29030 RepID=UPI003899602E